MVVAVAIAMMKTTSTATTPPMMAAVLLSELDCSVGIVGGAVDTPSSSDAGAVHQCYPQ